MATIPSTLAFFFAETKCDTITSCRKGAILIDPHKCSIAPIPALPFPCFRLPFIMLNTKELSAHIAAALTDAKAFDVTIIDVRGLTDITDQMILCSGTSSRHVSALAKQVVEALRKVGAAPASIEGENIGEWILVDYVDVVLHVMKRETREYYDIESLWDERFTRNAGAARKQNDAA